ncbi:MAG: DUF1178 family protein [Methylocystis sp.]|jgi:hypothetical protein|nr:DUF1178 family protein [Methylocystis sp.]MCA3582741.1 DUF1178 family protein [Methylocystis sp.]MCA3587053.1 DUF1178 family protein [Methylocystis sp.]MCA3592038.1 DUF1178 family protein [Methylocystis sp.]
MIKYALLCDNGHGFDSWFPSSASYETQRKRGLVDCPVCGSMKVGKQIMAPAVTLKSGRQDAAAVAPAEACDQPMAVLGEEGARLRSLIREFHDHVKANTEDVGARFAEEARKIHYGETEERAIRGRASLDDARALHEEGIGVLPLPSLPEERN